MNLALCSSKKARGWTVQSEDLQAERDWLGRFSAIVHFYNLRSEERTEFQERLMNMLFVQFLTLVLVLWNDSSKICKANWNNGVAQYIALLKYGVPPAPNLVKVYIQIIWRTGCNGKWKFSVRELKSLRTLGIHTLKEQRSFSTSHLCLWEILFQSKPKKSCICFL